jgi:hypothetical protein
MNIRAIGIGAPNKNFAFNLSEKIRRFGLSMPGAPQLLLFGKTILYCILQSANNPRMLDLLHFLREVSAWRRNAGRKKGTMTA